jgi:hypothetical protein
MSGGEKVGQVDEQVNGSEELWLSMHSIQRGVELGLFGG